MTAQLPGAQRRRQRERRQARRSATLAAVSTMAIVVLVGWLVGNADGWPAVREAFFSREAFVESLPDIVSAFWLNVRIFVLAEIAILVLALLLALGRNARSPLLFPVRVACTVYVDVLRGIPVLLVLFLLGFGVPALRLPGVPSDPVLWAGVALVLSYAAYVSEVYRAGIDAIPETQRAAARALGLTQVQALRHVVLPQAVRRVVPPLLNDFIALQKETALVGVLGPIEAARQAQIYSSRTFNFTSYVAAAAVFLAITIPLTRLTDWLLARQRVRRSAGLVR